MWVSHSFSPSFLIDAHSLTSTSLCGHCTPIACPLCCSCVPACYCIPCLCLRSAGIAVHCPGCNVIVYISCRWTSHCKFMHCPFMSRYYSTSLMSLRRSRSRSAHCGTFSKQAQEILPSTQSDGCASTPLVVRLALLVFCQWTPPRCETWTCSLVLCALFGRHRSWWSSTWLEAGRMCHVQISYFRGHMPACQRALLVWNYYSARYGSSARLAHFCSASPKCAVIALSRCVDDIFTFITIVWNCVHLTRGIFHGWLKFFQRPLHFFIKLRFRVLYLKAWLLWSVEWQLLLL